MVGAQYGQGLATCRTAHGWSAPVFTQITGASFGFQAGGQSTDLVLVGTNHKSAQDMLKEKVKLGGDVAASAGPVGRNSQASISALANAEFLTYSRSKGLFAGLDLTGDYINQNKDDTKAYYGKDIPYADILSGKVPTPASSARTSTRRSPSSSPPAKQASNSQQHEQQRPAPFRCGPCSSTRMTPHLTGKQSRSFAK